MNLRKSLLSQKEDGTLDLVQGYEDNTREKKRNT